MDLHALGTFLRSRRERLRPDDVGLPHGPRRRVPGLRRDEVARLADASVDYYTELEQGGGSQPSGLMLAALARALRLDADERDHLYLLAGRPLPSETGRAAHVHPGMLDLLTRLEGTPARVNNDLHITLVQNRSPLPSSARFRTATASRRASFTPGSPIPTPGSDMPPRSTITSLVSSWRISGPSPLLVPATREQGS